MSPLQTTLQPSQQKLIQRAAEDYDTLAIVTLNAGLLQYRDLYRVDAQSIDSNAPYADILRSNFSESVEEKRSLLSRATSQESSSNPKYHALFRWLAMEKDEETQLRLLDQLMEAAEREIPDAQLMYARLYTRGFLGYPKGEKAIMVRDLLLSIDPEKNIQVFAELFYLYMNAYAELGLEKRAGLQEALKQGLVAVDKGCLSLSFSLGCLHENHAQDLGMTDQDGYLMAYHWYRRAAESGLVQGSFSMGYLCYKFSESLGKTEEEGREEARRCFEFAAAKGHVVAMQNLGVLAEKAGEYKEAYEWYKKGAEGGFVNSWFKVGYLCCELSESLGKTEEEGREEARRCFEFAAAKGHVVAMQNLGVLAEKAGEYKEAYEWYKKAADSGSVVSYLNMGHLCCKFSKALGKTKEEGREEARHCFKVAAANKDIMAMYNLGGLAEREEKYKESYEWYKAAAKDGCVDSSFKVGYLCHEYFKELGKDKDEALEEAFSAYQMAAAKGCQYAKNNLTILIRDNPDIKGSEAYNA